MPMNREGAVRWVIYRDEGEAFYRIGTRLAGSAKEALSLYIQDHPDQEAGQRFGVRRSTMMGEFFIIKLEVPKQTFALVQA